MCNGSPGTGPEACAGPERKQEMNTDHRGLGEAAPLFRSMRAMQMCTRDRIHHRRPACTPFQLREQLQRCCVAYQTQCSSQGNCTTLMEYRSSSQKFAAALIVAVLATGAVAAFLLLRPTPQASQAAPKVGQAGGPRENPAAPTPSAASPALRPANSTSMLFPGVPQNRDSTLR